MLFPSPGHLPNPAIEPRSPALQADSLYPLNHKGSRKPKNTGVGSLSLLQQIVLTQESNRGLLHCRGILDQLSYQGHSGLWQKLKCASTWRVPASPPIAGRDRRHSQPVCLITSFCPQFYPQLIALVHNSLACAVFSFCKWSALLSYY